MANKFLRFLHIQQRSGALGDWPISVFGGFAGILTVIAVTLYTLGQTDMNQTAAAIIVASMGASAVLLFAVPHSALSQPWPLVVSHLIAAVIGVTCARYIPSAPFAAAAAVALAIAAMHLLRCIHPPGGATALAAVVGGEAVQSLGFQFVLTPVLINVLTILAIAMIVNYPFAGRRYPVSWALKQDPYPDISHADFVAALSEIETVVDVTEEDLLKIYDLVTRRR